MAEFYLTPSLVRKVWKNLYTGEAPILDREHLRQVSEKADEINRSIINRAYMPSLGHGYLGIEKGNGVTRFIPLLSKEDMAVYYQLCGDIGDVVIRNVKNVYGGWQAIPTQGLVSGLASLALTNRDAVYYQQNYYSSSFSSAAWFQQYRSFNDAITDLINNGLSGNFVATTDIANFYDSIETTKLMRKLRREDSSLHDHIDLLEVFLGYWNRRSSGYHPSTRGIPQEIISDASRNLSHFYLQEFDERFIEYCSSKGLTYLRWADDITLFGRSRQSLEAAIHTASQLLLRDGLNLSAPKTKFYSRRDFEKYRGLKFLAAVQLKDISAFRRELFRAVNATHPVKIDTIFRAAVGFWGRSARGRDENIRNLILGILNKNPSLFGTLNTRQMLSLVKISRSPVAALENMVKIVTSRDATSPKARLISMLRSSAVSLERSGISRANMLKALNVIERSSSDSEVILTYCIPKAKEKLTEDS